MLGYEIALKTKDAQIAYFKEKVEKLEEKLEAVTIRASFLEGKVCWMQEAIEQGAMEIEEIDLDDIEEDEDAGEEKRA